MKIYLIEDEIHAEVQGEFACFEEAVAELERRSKIPWDDRPNQAPCKNWKHCGRNYEIIEYDSTGRPWKEIKRTLALEVGASGFKWRLEEES